VSAADRPCASDIYCQCGRAWLEQYFGSIFERAVSVKMEKTILEGAKSCEFEITLK
jgi:predicted hydrocarbon binding protein